MACSWGFIAVFLSFSVLKSTFGAFDITYRNLELVANHLSTHNCHRLLVSLTFRSRDYPGDAAIDKKARLVDEDTSCILSLLNWSTMEEASYSALNNRLRQLGYLTLARTLSRQVYRTQSDSLAIAADETPREAESNVPAPSADQKEPTEGGGELFDSTITLTVAVLIGLMIVLAAVSEIWRYMVRPKKQDEIFSEEEINEKGEDFKDGRDRRLSALNDTLLH